MKFLNLVYEGVGGKKGVIDFGNKVHGLTVIQDAGKDFFKAAISLALYGAGEDYTLIDLPARIEFKFAREDNEYNLMRLYKNEEEGVSEFAVITDLAGKKVYAEGPAAVVEFVEQTLPRPLFDTLFILDKEKIAEAFTAEAEVRDAFIEESFAALPAAEEIAERLSEFKATEKELLARIESIPPVTKKEISDSRKVVATRETEAEAVRKDLEELLSDLGKAAAYESDTAEFYDATLYSQKLDALKDEIDGMAAALEKSRTLTDIKAVFTEYKQVEAALAEDKASLTAKEEELFAVSAKIAEGEVSAKAFEDKFIIQNERKELLEKKMRELIALSFDSPDALKISARVNSYYAEIENEKAALIEHLTETEKRYEELTAEVNALRARRAELKNSAEYKRNVENAAVYERDLIYIEREVKDADAALDALDKKRAELYARNVALSARELELRQELKNLFKNITGSNSSIEEAVNADVLYKQTIYAKHLIVSAQEVELDAVDKKIAAVKGTAEKYNKNLAEARARKQETEDNLNKFNEKLAVLNDKRSDYESYNKMNEIAEGLEYGSRCPVCDGFVTLKKGMAQKSTKALDAQIDAVKAEIAKSEAVLLEVINTIGQYDSATRVSAQYLEALTKTADAKRAVINEILAEYGAKDVAELFAMVKAAADESNRLTHMIDRYRKSEAELKAVVGEEAVVVAELKELTDKLIPAQNEKLKALIEEAAARGADFESAQHVLNDEKAEELLAKLQVVEDELEKTEELLSEKEEELNTLSTELEEVRRDIMLLETRAVTVEEGGKQLSYKDVIVKSVLSEFKAIAKEIDNAEEEKEIIKTRLAALRRVVAKAKDKKAALESEIAALKAKIQSTEKVAGAVYAQYAQKFGALGVADVADIDAQILSEETAAEYKKRIESYETESIKLNDKLERLSAALAENQPYYEAAEGLRETLAARKSDENEAIIRLGDAQRDRDEKIANYNERIRANVLLSNLQSRIKGIEELSPVIKDGKVSPADFAAAVAERVSSRIKNWSMDKYYLTVKDGRASLVNDRSGRAVKPDKYTKEERMLVRTGIATVYGEAIAKLYGVDFAPAAVIGADESDKNSLAALAEIAKDRELIAIPEDENTFYRNISKL